MWYEDGEQDRTDSSLKSFPTGSASYMLRICKSQQRGATGHPAKRQESATPTPPSGGEDVEQNSHSLLWERKCAQPLCKTIQLLRDPTVVLLGTYPKESNTYIHTEKLCTNVCTSCVHNYPHLEVPKIPSDHTDHNLVQLNETKPCPWGHPRREGHSRQVWQNVGHWRREWQTTSVFLPWEPLEQYEKAKW